MVGCGQTTVDMAHSRFATISEEEKLRIIEEKDAKKTIKQTKYAMNTFRCWLAARTLIAAMTHGG